MARLRCIEDLVEDFGRLRPIRGGSLIITAYGDAIVPRGGTVWLGSLIALLERLGLNQRLVRTSVFRLSKEGWLSSQQVGRRSYYSITELGLHRFDSASRRIYAQPHAEWDGVWRILVVNQVEPARRETLRRELGWLGFGSIAPGILGHPLADMDSVNVLLQDLGVQDDVILLRATGDREPIRRPLRQLVQDCWNLDQLADDYRRFLERFRPVWKALEGSSDGLEPEQGFQCRLLLIHDYRRVLLRDPQLPDELLPPDWVGAAARLLCRNLYRRLQGPAEMYLAGILETVDGPLPGPGPSFYKRFGGMLETADPSGVE